MQIQFYIVFIFTISWIYFCIAGVVQQQAEIKFFDKRYVSEARAFTSRRRRGEPYHTNATIVTRVPMDNNVTTKVVANVNNIGTIVFHDMKVCDAMQIPWLRLIRDTYTNFTDCPIPAGTYGIYVMELPPKNFPLPVPKGEGTLHLYAYLTHNNQLVFHGLMKVAAT